LFEQIPGIIGVARDEALRLFWCTRSFIRVSRRVESFEDIKGTTLKDVLTPGAAEEREQVQRRVMETGEVLSHYQFSADSRVLCTMFPLDEGAFGHKGVLSILKDAPIDARLGIEREIPVLSTPDLYELHAMTTRELEVLYFLAQGESTAAIGKALCRSPKTIENHINSIHRKLGTRTRGELVSQLSERGVQGFSRDEWARIVAGAARVRAEESGRA
jgi:DNA-binding CsgD family transcriptional regulator